MKRICIFCGSSQGARAEFSKDAQEMGREIVRRRLGLVYGGGRVGLMGILADAVLAEGGEVIGVIPRALATKELAHDGLSDLQVVNTMHERKARMAELADGFIALPGGLGTLEEFCEIVTWAQLGLHVKPCGLLNVEGYYDRLLGLFDHAVVERFVRPEHRQLVLSSHDPALLLDSMDSFRAPHLPKWIDEAAS